MVGRLVHLLCLKDLCTTRSYFHNAYPQNQSWANSGLGQNKNLVWQKFIKKYQMIIEFSFHQFRPNFRFGLDFLVWIFRSGPNRYLPNSARNTKCEINFNWMSHRWGESFCRSVNRQQLSFHSHFSINWSRSKKSKNLTGVRSSRDKQIIKREKQETEKEITQRKPKPNLKI